MAQHEGAAGGEAVASDSSQPANDPIEALVDEFLGDEDQEEPTADRHQERRLSVRHGRISFEKRGLVGQCVCIGEPSLVDMIHRP